MIASRVAIRYAKAALELALEKKITDAVATDMKDISITLKDSSELGSLLNSPIVKGEVKKNALNLIFKKIHPVTASIIDLLLVNKRVNILREVALQYVILYEKWKGQNRAVVSTAIPLSKELEKKILNKLKKLIGKEVSIENKIDKNILGGFVLRMGDMQYDASISRKLSNLKESLLH